MSNIIDKIRQLRELSKSSNINEATAATVAADKLIAKHRISEAQISIAERNADLPAQDDSYVLYETARIINWKNNLAHVLADHYGCAMWNDCVYGASERGRKISRYRLVGIQSDMDITRYMFAWLTLEIERLSKEHCTGRGHIYAQSYCEGAVAGIESQLELLKIEQSKSAIEAGQTTALACLDERLQKANLAKATLHPKLKKSVKYSKRYIDNSAYSVGQKDGKNIHLGKALGGGDSSKMLK